MIHVKLASSISIAFIGFILAAGVLASAQAAAPQAEGENQPQAQTRTQAPRRAAESQTDVAGSFYEAMNHATTANGVTQTPTNSAGGMFELRHIHSPFIGYEITYSYNPADQTIGPAPAPACGVYCNLKAQDMKSKGSLVGLDWVVSKKYGRLRPFLTGGLGFFIDEPAGTTYPVNDVVRPSYLYGGGVDFAFTDHLGLRAQYRGAVYKAPNLTTLFPAQGVFTQTSKPMGGIYYAF